METNNNEEDVIRILVDNCKDHNFIARRKSNISEQINKLSKILETNKTIKIFQLNYKKYPFTKEEIKSFSKALELNTFIKKMHLFGQVNVTTAKYLARGLNINKTIKTLYLECEVDNEAMIHLSKALGKESIIEKFYLSESKMKADGFKYFADAILINKNLKVLVLDHNNLFGCMQEFCESLKKNSTIEILSLIDTNLGPQDMNHISSMLKYNCGIKKLYLGQNIPGRESLQILSESLKINNTLELLSLSGGHINKIKPDPFKKITKFSQVYTMKFYTFESEHAMFYSEIILNNKSLTTLDLSNLGIKDVPIIKLANSLLKNNTLKFLNLESNQFSDDSVRYLCESLMSNTCLERLYLKDNMISDIGVKYLVNLLKTNSFLVEITLGLRINENGELSKLLPKLKNEEFKDIFLQIENLTKSSNINPKSIEKLNYLLHCNLKWSPNLHVHCSDLFKKTVFVFSLCLKRNGIRFKLPKYIIFEILKLIDRKSFLVKKEKIKIKKRKREDQDEEEENF